MTIKYLQRKGLPELAYRHLAPQGEGEKLPYVVFCGGFRSDMEGSKAQFLHSFCTDRGQGYVRFDYSGHGSSGGAFENGTIGSWRDDALAVIDDLTEGPVLLVGSSMGGWISLLVALARQDRIKGLVGIAAAPDFTKEIYEEEMSAAQRGQLEAKGHVDVPSEYSDEPYRITKTLIDNGNKLCLLDKDIALTIPVRLLHGMKDTDVPWQTAYRIKNAFPDDADIEVIPIEGGDHRLSKPEELSLLGKQIDFISDEIKA